MGRSQGRKTIELRDCTIEINETDQPYVNGRLGVYIAIHAKRGGEIYVTPTGNPMSGHATTVAMNVYAPD